MTADLVVEPLDPRRHDRKGFQCGAESLDRYLKTQASQDLERKANAVFVLVSADARNDILGYYTLCASSLAHGDVPEEARKRLPRYPIVSVTLLGRFATAQRLHGQGLGSILLADALRRAYDSASQVGSCMVILDAIDEKAASFYQRRGFLRLQDSMRFVMPMHAIAKYLLPGGETKAPALQASGEGKGGAAETARGVGG